LRSANKKGLKPASGKGQIAMILNHLQQGDGITALDSLRLYGVLRLAARIEELRKDGHTIVTQTVRVGRKEIARYSLVKEKQYGEARH
jgi:cbb3-type cytochrome oxidase cytochrome c subunit